MIVVHHLNDSRSQRVLWLLEELRVPYEVKRYERDPRTMLAPPELAAVHPLGKSPVVVDGDLVLAETGAIVEYLLETHDTERRLAPPIGAPARQRWRYWMYYAEGSAMPPLLLSLVFTLLPKSAPPLLRGLVRAVSRSAMTSYVIPEVRKHRAFWEAELAPTGWFAGSAFSAADIMMSFPLEAAASSATAQPRPNSQAFLARIHARPAYQRALERGGPYAYA